MALSQWICDELRDGIVLDSDVLYYLDVTFGTLDLPSVLDDMDSSETDSLLELIFYPDKAMQARFEAQWGAEIFSAQDQKEVVEALSSDPPVAQIVWSESDEKYPLEVPIFVLQAYVQRLNICWHPPEQLSLSLDKHCQGEEGISVRVLLRNARVEWNADQVLLVCQFVSKMEVMEDTIESDLAFLISLLSEMVPGDKPYDFLIAKKFFYFQSLCKAEDFERRLRNSNMEIMMLQGARSAYGSIDEWRRCMRTIDRICQYLFGRTQFFQQPNSECIDVQGGDGLDNIKDIMRHLT